MNRELLIGSLSWTARIFALGLALFWGAFFVEHLREWFLRVEHGLPPARVWFAQAAHLAVVAGLIGLWRWEHWGAVLSLVASLVFFGGLVVMSGPRSGNSAILLGFLAVTIVPGVISLICWHARKTPSVGVAPRS